MVDVKQILLAGGLVRVPFKRNYGQILKEAAISIFEGYFGEPKIIVDVDTVTIFKLAELDKAILCFMAEAMSTKNVWYRIPEIVRDLNSKGQYVDLSDPNDFKKVQVLQQKMNPWNQ